MPAAAWVTLAITALIIAAAALGLLRVIFHLGPSGRRSAPSSWACGSSPTRPAPCPRSCPRSTPT